jgi:hypothetical protein
MKDQVRTFCQFINEDRFGDDHRPSASVGIELGFGQTLQEYADYFSHLASIAPGATLIDIKVEDSEMNPNAMAVLTLTGEQGELKGLERFSMEMLGDSGLDDELSYREDHRNLPHA